MRYDHIIINLIQQKLKLKFLIWRSYARFGFSKILR